MTGHVAIVGAGPGDPDLATLAAVRELSRADVVYYDALSPSALLAYAPPHAEQVYVGKRAAAHAMKQREIEAHMVAAAKAGKRVVRLKGGDPFVFGRGGEEVDACRAAGVPYTVVPGITSAIAAPESAGIPVTHRGLAANFLVITGNPSEDGSPAIDWAWAARADTLVVLMGASTIEDTARHLQEGGRNADTPAAFIRWGTRPDQQVITGTLGTLADLVRAAGAGAPAVIVVGEVAQLASESRTPTDGRLRGRRVVVTRARTQASELAGMLRAEGAQVVEAPVIEIEPRAGDWTSELLSPLPDWLLLTSVNAVDSFMSSLLVATRDARALAGVRIASIGEATSVRLAAHGLRPDFVPSRATSSALCAELPALGGEVAAYPVSALADDALERGLQERGVTVRRATAYESHPRPLDEQQLREIREADAITFTSASTARFLAAALGDPATTPGARLVSIGQQTSAAVREQFGRVDTEAATPSLDALVEAVVRSLAE